MAIELEKGVYQEIQSLLQTPVETENAAAKAEEVGLLTAAVWINENPDDFVEGIKSGFAEKVDDDKGIVANSVEASETVKKKRHWTKRQLPIPINEFMETVVKPIMAQVAANKLKKNLGMVIGALAARCSVFPSADYRCNCRTNPLQTFSADLTRFHMHPKYIDAEGSSITQGVEPDFATPLHECEIPVYPTMTAEYGMSPAIIQRFENLCSEYDIDSTMFTKTGGKIKIDKNFLTVAAYFASDRGLSRDQKLWGEMTVINHIPADLLKEEDKPSYLRIQKPSTGRKRGRPRKVAIETATIATTEQTEEPVSA